jgi:hypothetical protein
MRSVSYQETRKEKTLLICHVAPFFLEWWQVLVAGGVLYETADPYLVWRRLFHHLMIPSTLPAPEVRQSSGSRTKLLPFEKV